MSCKTRRVVGTAQRGHEGVELAATRSRGPWREKGIVPFYVVTAVCPGEHLKVYINLKRRSANRDDKMTNLVKVQCCDFAKKAIS